MTPTARSLRLLRSEGYMVEVTERWIPHVNRRRDLFGFADVLAVHPRDKVFLLVQVTTVGHVADRLKKAKAVPALRTWLAAGGRFEVWGWAKRASRWEVRRVEVCGQDLVPIDLAPRRPRRQRKGSRQGLLFDLGD